MFGIKESKRSSLEQRALREVVMGMAGGEGAPEGLAGMFEAMSGKGAGAGEMDPQAWEKMMGDAGAGGVVPGVPDVGNMSREQVAEMSREALQAVREGLREGSITRREVDELEKIMGMDIKQMVALMDAGKIDKARLQKELGSDVGDLLDIFKQLAKIK